MCFLAPFADPPQAAPVLDDGLFVACVRRLDTAGSSPVARRNLAWSPDDELIYEGFNEDFGPLNLACTVRFCRRVEELRTKARQGGGSKAVYIYTRNTPHSRANCAVLLGAYLVLYKEQAPEDAYARLESLKPFAPFRDASCMASTFSLTVLDCLRGLQRGADVGHLDFHLPGSKFDVHEYERRERVENGDMNWILPAKFLAFSGPQPRRAHHHGSVHVPEDYVAYFQRHNVQGVVRLNKKLYEARRFEDRGVRVHELYFPDGSCPPQTILRRFMDIAEQEPGALAVHCKAGLGRTGVLISCYNMKHYGFTAREALAYIRICRPGSVIGPQQHFLCEMEQRMWMDGHAFRAKHGLPPSDRAPQPASAVTNGRDPRAAAFRAGGPGSPSVMKSTQMAYASPSVRKGTMGQLHLAGGNSPLSRFNSNDPGRGPVPSSAPIPGHVRNAKMTQFLSPSLRKAAVGSGALGSAAGAAGAAGAGASAGEGSGSLTSASPLRPLGPKHVDSNFAALTVKSYRA